MTKRLSINISDKTFAELSTIAEEDGVTITEVVRRSILTENFLREQQAAGELVVLEDAHGNQRQLVFL